MKMSKTLIAIAAISALSSVSVYAATVSTGLKNSIGSSLKLTHATGGSGGYCAANGNGAPCTPTLSHNGQQWVNLDQSSSHYTLSYNVCADASCSKTTDNISVTFSRNGTHPQVKLTDHSGQYKLQSNTTQPAVLLKK